MSENMKISDALSKAKKKEDNKINPELVSKNNIKGGITKQNKIDREISEAIGDIGGLKDVKSKMSKLDTLLETMLDNSINAKKIADDLKDIEVTNASSTITKKAIDAYINYTKLAQSINGIGQQFNKGGSANTQMHDDAKKDPVEPTNNSNVISLADVNNAIHENAKNLVKKSKPRVDDDG